MGVLWLAWRETRIEKKYKWLLIIGFVVLSLIIIFVKSPTKTENLPPPPKTETALLWGEIEGKVIVPLITVWKYSPCEKPWPPEKYTGEWIITTASHKTEVSIMEKTENQGETCYKVELPEGKVIGWINSSFIKTR